MQDYRNAAIIYSRMDSQRLPEKALMKIGKYTLLEHCILRIKDSNKYQTIVATSDRSIDNSIEELTKKHGVLCFRGSAFNLIERTTNCISEYNITNFARVNGDSPFSSKELLEIGFQMLNQGDYDMVTNLVPRRFPYGLSVEILKSEIFRNKSIRKEIHPEHITSFFYDNLAQFNVGFIEYDAGTNDHDLRFTVDTKEDLQFLTNILKSAPDIFEFPYKRIIELIKISQSDQL